MEQKTPIDDGYTDIATVAKSPLRPAFDITFRPVGFPAATAHRLAPRPDAEAVTKLGVKLIMDHVCGWTRTNKKGEPIPFCEEAVKTLTEPQFNRVLDIITDYAGSDQEAADVKN
jgi:hypothetical protein